MAIEFKKINTALKNAPLSKDEISMVDMVEAYVDEVIINQFKGFDVSIPLSIAKFDYDKKNKRVSNLPSIRKILMREELEKRYDEAGWKITLHIDDGLDGPNMSGSDYWILSGKEC